MRGKLPRDYPVCRIVRIIPAHAGQTDGSHRPSRQPPDHPRACGANFSPYTFILSLCGSSPRMRGKQTNNYCCHCFPRIIPAHAGQTELAPGYQTRAPDHPRACGANVQVLAVLAALPGSSPRMRGKLEYSTVATRCQRIIPAHAGQTCAGPQGPQAPSDHPRACGANISSTHYSSIQTGSSPRMRGKHWKDYHKGFTVRIIPAHAGQTGVRAPRTYPQPDHPRACGANPRIEKNLPR